MLYDEKSKIPLSEYMAGMEAPLEAVNGDIDVSAKNDETKKVVDTHLSVAGVQVS